MATLLSVEERTGLFNSCHRCRLDVNPHYPGLLPGGRKGMALIFLTVGPGQALEFLGLFLG